MVKKLKVRGESGRSDQPRRAKRKHMSCSRASNVKHKRTWLHLMLAWREGSDCCAHDLPGGADERGQCR